MLNSTLSSTRSAWSRAARRSSLFLTLAALLLATACSSDSDGERTDEATDFSGKSVRLIVPYGAGGTFDTLGRLVARHMSKHLPGKPQIEVHNNDSGGGLVGISEALKAEPDGLTIIHFGSAFALTQFLGLEDLAVDEFRVLGTAGGTSRTLFTRAGVTLDDLRNADDEVRFAGAGVTRIDDATRVAIALAGLDAVRIVEGYDGQADAYVAVSQQEVAGTPASVVDYSVNPVVKDMIDNRQGQHVLFVGGEEPGDDVSHLIDGVPRLDEMVTDEDEKQMLSAYSDMLAAYRVFFAPPGVNDATMEILTNAFDATLKDPEFLADADNVGLRPNTPLIGTEAESAFNAILKLPADQADRLREILLEEN